MQHTCMIWNIPYIRNKTETIYVKPNIKCFPSTQRIRINRTRFCIEENRFFI